MVRWPGTVKPGSVINDVASGLDWFPTLAAAAGVPDVKEKLLGEYQAGNKSFKVHLDGYDLGPAFRGETKEWPRKDIFYFTDDGDLACLRHTRWKVVYEPYRSYKEICRISLEEAFREFGISGGRGDLIERYFAIHAEMELYPDVLPTLEKLSRRHRLALVSNTDDDLLAATRLHREFDLVCTAQRARGYKPDGTLFQYLLANAGVDLSEILHSGQSQFTDMVGGKPLGLTIAWINRRGIALHDSVPRPDHIFSDIRSLLSLLSS
jgi:2-haloacid dehalogenase